MFYFGFVGITVYFGLIVMYTLGLCMHTTINEFCYVILLSLFDWLCCALLDFVGVGCDCFDDCFGVDLIVCYLFK